MSWKKSSLYPIPVSIALLIGLTNPASYPVQAQLPSRPISIAQEIQRDWNEFEPPETGLPGRRIGGGTRGGSTSVCPSEVQDLTALVPELTYGRTVKKYPTILIYVPPLSEVRNMQFSLLKFAQDDSYEEVYVQKFQSQWAGGVMRISLPNYGPSVEVGGNYYWDFSISCNPDDSSGDVLVSGWIERVPQSDTLAGSLQNAKKRDLPDLYVKEGLWYDAAATLASLRMSQPENLTLASIWQNLLGSVKLGKIAEKRLQPNSASHPSSVANQQE